MEKELTKIKLKINLFDRNINTQSPKGMICYYLKIFITYVDGRFYLSDGNTDVRLYTKKDFSFNIISSFVNVKGLLTEKYLYLPTRENLGKEIIFCFFEDKKRKELLKKLYDSLKEWGSDWEGFSDTDYDTRMIVKDDVWELKSNILPF